MKAFITGIKKTLILLTRPLVVLLARLHVHPNILTLMGFLVTLCAAWLYLSYPMWIAALVLLAAGLFDTLDGQVARETGAESKFGALLDSVIDRLSEFAIFAALLWRFRDVPWQFAIMFLAMAASVMISYTRARGEGLLAQTKAGPMPRAVRYFWIIIASFLPPAWFVPAMILFTALAWLTVARRCWELYTFLSPLSAGSEDKERR
ncbi:MAG: CDP-alcohol phosphatidyltransferase family protein [candidate division WOR-3 bacterium]